MKLAVLVLNLFLSVSQANENANYPFIIFPQGLIEINNVCVSDFGATLTTINPVTHCIQWVMDSKQICSFSGDSEACRDAKPDEVTPPLAFERPHFTCAVSKTEKLKTTVSYQRTICDEYASEASDKAGHCLLWRREWATWPYKHLYNIPVKANDRSNWFGAVATLKLPKCQ